MTAPYKPNPTRHTQAQSQSQTPQGEKSEYREQWAETALRPSITQRMDPRSIEECGRALAKSYGCDERDITFTFRQILLINNETGEEYYETDFLLLVYTLKFVCENKVCARDVFKLKIVVPDYIKEQARAMIKPRPGPVVEEVGRAVQHIAGPVVMPTVEDLPAGEPPRTRPIVPKRPGRH